MVGEPKPYLDKYWTADDSIESVRHLSKGKHRFAFNKFLIRLFIGDKSANLLVLFCNDPKYFGTVGIAYVGGLCDLGGYQVSLNEWRSSPAKTGKVRERLTERLL